MFACLKGIAEVQVLHHPLGLDLFVFGSTDPRVNGAETDHPGGALRKLLR